MAVAIGLWSVAVAPGEPMPIVPEGDIRITNCALGDELEDEKRNTLKLTYIVPSSVSDGEEEEEDEDEPTLVTTVICSLTGGRIEQASTDVTLEEGSEYLLQVIGKNTIYVTGNYVDQTPPNDLPPFDDSDDEDAYNLGDVGSDEEMPVDELDSDAGRFEEIVDEPKSSKRSRTEDDEEAAEAKASDKKTKKLKAASGEAAPAPAAAEEKTPSKKEKKKKGKEAAEPAKVEEKAEKAAKELPGGIKFKDSKVGTGPTAKSGNTVGMRYIGKLQNGHVFDKNTKGKPFTFKLGGGEVIKGWDVGIAGMQVGGERLLTIPAAMAYGKRKMGDIPANSTLIFEVKLIEIK